MNIVISDEVDRSYMGDDAINSDDVADLRLELADLHEFAKVLADAVNALQERVKVLEAKAKQ